MGNNAALTSLEGLKSVNNVGGYLFVFSNASLTSLNGLESIAQLNGFPQVFDNTEPTSLEGLESITAVGGHLRVAGNLVLAPCWIDWLLTGITSLGGKNLSSGNNGNGTCPER